MIASTIEGLLQQAKNRDLRVDEAALVALRAFPVPWAWEGCFGILSTGEVIYVDENGTPGSFEPVEKLHTLVCAVRRYPELAPLLPERPDDASPCPECLGQKTLNSKFKLSSSAALFCGECQGLGWVVLK